MTDTLGRTDPGALALPAPTSCWPCMWLSLIARFRHRNPITGFDLERWTDQRL
jgi:hypothetical protein